MTERANISDSCTSNKSSMAQSLGSTASMPESWHSFLTVLVWLVIPITGSLSPVEPSSLLVSLVNSAPAIPGIS